ncbi:MAG: divalent-cation tolerance protein CutA [Candidatus Acidiferrales bacterium]
MTNDAIIVCCACASREEAARIARAVVEARLAACVNVLPEVESIYRWQGKIETAREVLLLIKTAQWRFAELRDCIAALHSYEVPEIVAFSLSAGAESYFAWLREQVARPN